MKLLSVLQTDADARIGHQDWSVFPFSGHSGLNVIRQGLRSEAVRTLDLAPLTVLLTCMETWRDSAVEYSVDRRRTSSTHMHLTLLDC